jgi:malonyl-CoA/methylmalonyl-CoA synthetase
VRALSGQDVLERYGMTETIMNVSNPYVGERRPGSVGLPLPGVEVQIVDGGSEAAEGKIGEVQVRGPNVFPGYWNRKDATAEAFTEAGWLRTGDLGWRSSDGYITIAGRAKELIISGGLNVYPREVEEVLEEHPQVAEAAVAGVPSLEWGEEVAAFVVCTVGTSPTEEDLVSWCRERLAPYKRPRHLSIVPHLPRNAMGKIVRARLTSDGRPN